MIPGVPYALAPGTSPHLAAAAAAAAAGFYYPQPINAAQTANYLQGLQGYAFAAANNYMAQPPTAAGVATTNAAAAGTTFINAGGIPTTAAAQTAVPQQYGIPSPTSAAATLAGQLQQQHGQLAAVQNAALAAAAAGQPQLTGIPYQANATAFPGMNGQPTTIAL